jgi:hypothetical protein
LIYGRLSTGTLEGAVVGVPPEVLAGDVFGGEVADVVPAGGAPVALVPAPDVAVLP